MAPGGWCGFGAAGRRFCDAEEHEPESGYEAESESEAAAGAYGGGGAGGRRRGQGADAPPPARWHVVAGGLAMNPSQ